MSAPSHVAGVALIGVPTRGASVTVGVAVATGAAGATTPVCTLAAELLPRIDATVTATRSRQPTSVCRTRYVRSLPYGTLVHAPAASQRCHARETIGPG